MGLSHFLVFIGGKTCKHAGVLLALAVGICVSGSVHAQGLPEWQTYRAADGLSESLSTSVSLGPRSHVWIRHGEFNALSLLDGYVVQRYPAPAQRSHRVYESRAGRIFSTCEEGLLEFRSTDWALYPLELLSSELQKNPLRQTRQPFILPAEQDRVLILASDQLLDYRLLSHEITVLRRAELEGLGKYSSLSPARDGGVWVTAANGIAKVPGPLRQIRGDSLWEEHLLPSELRVTNLNRCFEDDDGGVTTVGESLSLERRIVLRLQGTNWTVRHLPGENPRLAWRDWRRDHYWAITQNSLLRISPTSVETVRCGLNASQYYDVAVEPKGAFWLATLEGVERFAPPVWRTPAEVAADRGPVQSMTMTSNRLWFATAETLAMLEGPAFRSWSWPPQIERSFRDPGKLMILKDGRVLCGVGGEVLLFDPTSTRFSALSPRPDGLQLKTILGLLPGGRVCLQAQSMNADRKENSFLVFDGESLHPYEKAPFPVQGSDELSFLQETQGGEVWIGGPDGPSVWRDTQWQRFGSAEGYSDDGAHCWMELAEGKIWVGGLRRISEYDGRRWSIIHAGLDHVHAMERSPNGGVWVATGSGLYRHSKDSWVGIGLEEGLPASSVLSLLRDGAEGIWVGTSRGLSRYFPQADTEAPKTLAVRADFEGNTVESRPVTLSFQAVDRWKFTPVNRLLFSHRLDDGNWSSFVADSRVVFQELSAGPHRIEVRSMDRNWNVEVSPALFEFTVVVPWFREPRIVGVALAGVVAALFFAGLAVNRHIQLRRSYALVERTVQERTRELEVAMEKLGHSQKMTALGTLAAGVAHDFNHILSIIKGSVQIIESNLDNQGKVRTRLERIHAMVDQGSGIVKAMLGFGRTGEYRMEVCDVRSLAAQTIRAIGDRAVKGVQIKLDAPPAPVLARGIPDLMQQVFLNLLLNGADSMPEGGRLTVRIRSVQHPPEVAVLAPASAAVYLVVSIQDTGLGIPPEVLPRIFEPFFTTKSFSSRHGVGLGLYMVYEFAKEMGHGIVVESQVGQGSTFSLYMPSASLLQSAGTDPAEGDRL
jgi:signal transduction histidine kinase/ligand-binding sensor domain-containing protein